jgi:hypothetical protein
MAFPVYVIGRTTPPRTCGVMRGSSSFTTSAQKLATGVAAAEATCITTSA